MLATSCYQPHLPTSHVVDTCSCKQERKLFDEKFIRLDTRRLCELTSAADALDMKPLVDLTSRALARMIEGKSAEEIRSGNLARHHDYRFSVVLGRLWHKKCQCWIWHAADCNIALSFPAEKPFTSLMISPRRRNWSLSRMQQRIQEYAC